MHSAPLADTAAVRIPKKKVMIIMFMFMFMLVLLLMMSADEDEDEDDWHPAKPRPQQLCSSFR